MNTTKTSISAQKKPDRPTPGSSPSPLLSTRGFQIQASAIAQPKTSGRSGHQLQNIAITAQPSPTQSITPIIQRHRTPNRIPDLKSSLGKNKSNLVKTANLEGYFNSLNPRELTVCRNMQNTKFDRFITKLSDQSSSSPIETTASIAQASDLVGAVVETGESAAEITKQLPTIFGSLTSIFGAGVGTALASFGGAVGGLKDTIDGVSTYRQGKTIEALMTGASGVLGLASLVGPDILGMIGAGTKTAGGITKFANAKLNHNAINRLKAESSTSQFQDILDILDQNISYIEGIQQTLFGGLEGAASLSGIGSLATSLLSKGTDNLPNLTYAGRALGSTVTSRIDSNATVQGQEKQEKSSHKLKIRNLVLDTNNNPIQIGRLHRLASLIEPDLAEEIDRTLTLLGSRKTDPTSASVTRKLAIKQQIQSQKSWF
jgi:hypothetical protein